MVKGLKGKTYEKQLRSLVFFSLEMAEGRPLGSLEIPHKGSRGAGAELCFLVIVIGLKGMAWSRNRGSSGWASEKGYLPRESWGTRAGSPRKWSQHQACRISISIWTTLTQNHTESQNF